MSPVRFIAAASFLLGSIAFAQQQDPEDSGRAADMAARLAERVWELEAAIGTDYIIGSRIAGPADSVDISSNRFRLTARGPGWIGSFITASLGYEARLYDWDDGSGFLIGTDEPWETVHQLSTNVTIFQGLSERWGAIIRLDGRLSAEAGADLTDGFSGSLLIGGGYQFTKNFRAGLGVILIKRFEGDLIYFPGIQLDWQIDEQWRFAIEGPGAELTWRPNDEWLFGLGIRGDGRRFRLEENGPGNSGIVQEVRVPVGLRATWSPTEKLDITLRGGVDILRQWRLEDRNGQNDRVIESRPGGFVGLSLAYTF